MEDRYLLPALAEHLRSRRQMIFLTGPRQVGKTSLAKRLVPKLEEGINYFNWDNAEHRKELIRDVFANKVDFAEKRRRVVVFDEIHKFPRWKNALKGLFDVNEPHTRWIVTGSAALNVYRKGQDSLLGRQFTYHLHPFSLAEVLRTELPAKDPLSRILSLEPAPADKKAEAVFARLSRYGGFPEPYFADDERFLIQWRTARLDRLINQDLATLENLKNLPLVELLSQLLPDRIGSPLSLNALREDLEVHFTTVKHWMDLLERVFYGFRVLPFAQRASRMLKKEAKWYLWDWTPIENAGARFENLIAVHLAKFVACVNDLGLGELSLHYVRDLEKREVDFIICDRRKPVIGVECKLSSDEVPRSLSYFAEKLKLKRAFLVCGDAGARYRSFSREGRIITSLSAVEFLRALA